MSIKLQSKCVLGVLLMASPLLCYAYKVCSTDSAGKETCIEIECLPSQKDTLSKVPETEVDLCMKKMNLIRGASTSGRALEIAKAECKGGLEKKGNVTICRPEPVIPKTSNSASARVKTAKESCTGSGGVWAGPAGAETCTGGPKK